MTAVRDLLRSGERLLAEAGVPTPQVDAARLLEHAWRIDASDLQKRALIGGEVPVEVEASFTSLVSERSARVPLQHLTGRAWFRHLELRVGPGVFVPRPETETIVDLAIEHLPRGGTVVDLCTGSGCIPLALKQERPDASVHGVELDEHAFAWATANRDDLGLDVDLRRGRAQDAFDDLLGAVDVVVSNPPYVPDGMVPVDPEVRDHDPAVALFGGSEDGLRIPLEVADRAHDLLVPGGLLVMEHADTQGESLPRALSARGWRDAHDLPDLTGRPRFAIARR